MQPENSGSSPEITCSDLFDTTGADVTFISSDFVLFKMQSTHLSLNSVGFVQAGEHIIAAEPVALEESSQVLEILFQFIEPPPESRNFRHPEVDDIMIDLFFELAEAAEKYIVYAAVGVCLARMKQLLEEYPFEVLNHCARHGHPDLADRAAEITIS
ncbi:hypothetical protein BDN70DRAFT_843093, partial [Pholiota conissans]